jgi:hypothetical protein
MSAFTFRAARGQRGVGMVEVMVAMALGAMVVLGVIQVFTTNRQTFRMQDGMAITQEAGAFAADFIARDLLRSGYDSPADADTDDSAFEWANTTDGGAGGNDRIAIVYSPEQSGDRYCTGEDATGVDLISNRYWVTDEGELFCQGAAFSGVAGVFNAVGTPQVLAENVESFQVLFGVDSHHLNVDTDGDGVGDTDCPAGLGEPTLYVPAPLAVPAITRGELACDPDTGAAQNSATVVRVVRIALLLRTENEAGALVPADRFWMVLDQRIGAPQIEPDDGRLRRLFTRTVVMRNAQDVEAADL